MLFSFSLSPLHYLFTPLTTNYSPDYTIKVADDTTVVGLSNNDESANREEMVQHTEWCIDNNLSFNVDKTKNRGLLTSGGTTDSV